MTTKTKTTKKILSVHIVQDVDMDPDFSHLGDYHSDYREGAIDRKERGDMDRNSHRYFSPAMTADETGNPNSPEQDYQRMENYNRGIWCFIGIHVEAKIQLINTIQTISSGGLWGIESDSDRTYFDQVRKEELSQLSIELKAIGFTKKQIDTAFRDIDE